MKSSRLFWGFVVIILGVIFLLSNLGFLPVNFWQVFWPFALIVLGLWFLVAPRLFRGKVETQAIAVALENTTEAELEINHGAGRLLVSGGAAPANLFDGNFVGDVAKYIYRQNEKASVKLNADAGPVFIFPVGISSEGFQWDMHLNSNIPFKLRFHTGAGESVLNLRDVKAHSIVLETGASSTEMTLPANAGLTDVKISSGAASVILHVPEGVAARIKVESGLAGINIDSTRFPYNGTYYETPGFDTASNRVMIKAETGISSLEISS